MRMAKIKGKLIQTNNIGPLQYVKRNNLSGDFSHIVKTKQIPKGKKKS